MPPKGRSSPDCWGGVETRSKELARGCGVVGGDLGVI